MGKFRKTDAARFVGFFRGGCCFSVTKKLSLYIEVSYILLTSPVSFCVLNQNGAICYLLHCRSAAFGKVKMFENVVVIRIVSERSKAAAWWMRNDGSCNTESGLFNSRENNFKIILVHVFQLKIGKKKYRVTILFS